MTLFIGSLASGHSSCCSPGGRGARGELLEHDSSEHIGYRSIRSQVLIPARNEAASFAGHPGPLEKQGKDLAVVVIDDQSSDGTAELAEK